MSKATWRVWLLTRGVLLQKLAESAQLVANAKRCEEELEELNAIATERLLVF
jgi:hypothetical protein